MRSVDDNFGASGGTTHLFPNREEAAVGGTGHDEE